MLDLNALVVFAKVAEAKSFSEAARRLGSSRRRPWESIRSPPAGPLDAKPAPDQSRETRLGDVGFV